MSDLKDESTINQDILQIDIPDVYGLNVVKKLIMGLKWVSSSCSQTEYIIKLDDDVFVDIPVIVNKLKSPDYRRRISGHMVDFALTRRFGKYQMSFQEYPYFLLPEYQLGYYYIVPRDAARKLVEHAIYIPYLRMEDVYITGILPRAAGVELAAFRHGTNGNYFYSVCDFVTGKLDAYPLHEPSDIQVIWNTYLKPDRCR